MKQLGSFVSFKKCESNNIGPLILNHIKNHAEGLYKYLMRDKPCHDDLAKKIANDMNKAFGGFNVMWNNSFNHLMVDYKMICVLKFCGYSSWGDVTTKLREICYKDYNAKCNLPIWNTGQER